MSICVTVDTKTIISGIFEKIDLKITTIDSIHLCYTLRVFLYKNV